MRRPTENAALLHMAACAALCNDAAVLRAPDGEREHMGNRGHGGKRGYGGVWENGDLCTP